ncbi:AMP-binding protein [Streptomyces sp. NPDC091040]|uniref:AMP-binding protein n=1 Tax=Streptomyces sp. NPDC091040 TaxID=3365972 RepID=UPI00380C9A95
MNADYSAALWADVSCGLSSRHPCGTVPIRESIAYPFLEQATTQPHREAVRHSSGVYTYGQLAERAISVTGGLQDFGVTPGSRISLIANRDPQLIVSVIACLMAGAIVSVVDASYPVRRIHGMVTAARPACVLVAGTRYRSDSGIPVLSTDEIAFRSGTVAANASAHAYLGHTSGTTGHPKLVNGTHSAVRHFIQWYTQKFKLDARTRFAMISGLSHDPLWRDIFLPLSIGGQVHIPDVRTWAHGEKLAAWLQENAITDLNTTPTMARRFLTGQGGPLTALRRVVLGGEPTYWDDLRSFTRSAPAATFVPSYGATETPQIAALGVLDPGDIGDQPGMVPLGAAAPGFELMLVDEAGVRLSGEGFGEIVVRSPHIAHGYFDTENSTGFSVSDDVRTYATGDMAYRTAQGNVVFRGRDDRRIKVRGVRIESTEIESAIRELPEVVDSVVVMAPPQLPGKGLPASEKLLAFVATRESGSLSERQVKSHLAKALPAPAVPEYVSVTREFPIGTNGKVDLPVMLDEWRKEVHTRAVPQTIGAARSGPSLHTPADE